MQKLIEEFILTGKTLYKRGLAGGSSGNMSVIIDEDTVIASPTNVCLGELDKEHISIVDMDGNLKSGPNPTKEILFHLAIYKVNPNLKAIIHLHSTYATAYSCLEGLNKDSVFKPFTPYVVMKMGDIPLVTYHKPGSPMLAKELSAIASNKKAFLMSNHGCIACGKNLKEALNNAEEFEETAKVFFVLHSTNLKINYLTPHELNELKGD